MPANRTDPFASTAALCLLGLHDTLTHALCTPLKPCQNCSRNKVHANQCVYGTLPQTSTTTCAAGTPCAQLLLQSQSQSPESRAARRALRRARLPDPGALPAACALLAAVPGVPTSPPAAAAAHPPQLLGDFPAAPQLPQWNPPLPGDLPRGVLTTGQAAEATAGVTAAPLGTLRWGLIMRERERLPLQLRSPCLLSPPPPLL